MGWLLVTNDDGVDSPALLPLAAALARLGRVEVVVPDRERSWVGKAITRFEPVTVDVVDRAGFAVHAVSGFPADCVQLGLHALFDEPPSLVVSGINIGYNHGSAFLQSSGTVGAAVEASIAGVGALALSAGSVRPWKEWRPWVFTPDAAGMWERLAAIAADLVERMLAVPAGSGVLSVNMPDTAGPDTPRRVTTVAEVGYDRLFRRRSDGVFVHDFGGGLLQRAGLEGTDVEAAAEGVVAITPIRSAHTGTISPDLRAALER